MSPPTANSPHMACLHVDLTGDHHWEKTENIPDALHPRYTSSSEEAIVNLTSGVCAAMVIRADDSSIEFRQLMSTFQHNVGALPHHILIVSTNPSIGFMTEAFEFGVDSFASETSWEQEAIAMRRRSHRSLNDDNSIEAKVIKLTAAVRGSRQEEAAQLRSSLVGEVRHDFLAAFTVAKSCELLTTYSEAIEIYQQCLQLNRWFRPAASALSEALLLVGKIDEATSYLEGLKKTNPDGVSARLGLAIAKVETGDIEGANSFIEKIEEFSPGDPRTLEVRAYTLMSTGRVAEAFKLMDQMSQVGPFFAAKMNELGIKLSQAGKGKSALALFEKAHKIVRSELQYKISLNAALACRRLGDWDRALHYIARCQTEYGSDYPKLEKIKRSVLNAQAKQRMKNAS